MNTKIKKPASVVAETSRAHKNNSYAGYGVHQPYNSIPQKAKKYNIPADIFEQVKSRLDILTVMERYGVYANNKGYACCPFHGEKTPSFRAFTSDNGFYCFGCGVGGTVIDFVMNMYNLNGIDAAKKLNIDFHLNLIPSEKMTFEDYERSRREAEKREKDKQLINDFKEWEESAFRAVSNCFWALTFYKEQIYVNNSEYFKQYTQEVKQIDYIENILDIMINNTGNFDAQVNFTKDIEGWWN